MWKRSLLAVLVVALVWSAWRAELAATPQRQVLPPGPMQDKARLLCLACHDARIIVQQQLDRRAWERVMDKMIRWGTPVPAEERDALVDYFAQNFSVPPERAEKPELAAGPGAAKVKAACLGCHDAGVIVEQRLDRRDWQALLEKKIRWGVEIAPADRSEILNYLARHYAATPPAKRQR